jgi:hypothetical protein
MVRYDLDLMGEAEAFQLLSDYLYRPLTAAEEEQAKEFARVVGYLPLALELGATQVEYGYTWAELVAALSAEMAQLETLNLDWEVDDTADEAVQKHRSLLVSLKLSLKQLSPQLLEQFAWLGLVPEDVALTPGMAATLWQVDPHQEGSILRELHNRALLLPQAQRAGERPTYRIHDLVHLLAQKLLTHQQYLGDLPGLGLALPQAHEQFLARYRTQTTAGQWHTLPADGYIHRQLSWHFEQAQRADWLHELLQETNASGRNGWYDACDRLGQVANFITDVGRAWTLAETAYAEARSPEALVLQVRYALITSTLNTLASNIPAALIGVFVEPRGSGARPRG